MRRAAVAAFVAGVVATAVGRPLTPSATAAEARRPPGHELSWLDLGDSYASGEGASGANGWCQRSPRAGGPKAAAILREQRGWRIAPTVFAACTGHLATDVFSSRVELATTMSGAPEPGPAGAEVLADESLRRWAGRLGGKDRKYDVVVSSLGGNDVHFSDIVIDCTDMVRRLVVGANAVAPSVTGSPWEALARGAATSAAADGLDPAGCGTGEASMRAQIDHLVDQPSIPTSPGSPAQGRTVSLVDLYRTLADDVLADGGVLVILGYPRLLTPSSTWGAWRGGQCNLITASDADRLGRAAAYFDQKLRAAVKALGPRFAYVSRLDVFDDGGRYHSLCGRGVEWLNTPLLFLRDGTLRKERGFHPNDLGYLATGEKVAAVVEARLGVAVAPSTTSTALPATTEVPSTTTTTVDEPDPPPIDSGESHFDVGDRFRATCTIAWPTAPTRTTSGIEMRTTCSGVPAQFLFVDIGYDDPDLPVTPSRATMDVEGEVVDIARSEFGFTSLVVWADRIRLR